MQTMQGKTVTTTTTEKVVTTTSTRMSGSMKRVNVQEKLKNYHAGMDEDSPKYD